MLNFMPAGLWKSLEGLPYGLYKIWRGRYRVIQCGIWTMWFGAMLNGVSLVIGKVVEAYGTDGDPWMSLFSKFIMGIGLGVFQANIVQFGIDQLIDTSSVEIKSVIAWYTMTIFTSGITMYYSSYCAQEYVACSVNHSSVSNSGSWLRFHSRSLAQERANH